MASIVVAGCRLYYEVWGGGSDATSSAVVLCHSKKYPSLMFYQQVPHFASRAKTIVIEMRGFGRTKPVNGDGSDGVWSEENIHPAHFADDLKAILDAEKIKQAHIVCVALGGYVTSY